MSEVFEVLITDEFGEWYEELDETDTERVFFVVSLLESKGVKLKFPHSSSIEGTKFPLRELRVQSKGRPLRVLYAFNPERNALLLLGGDKGGNDRWYVVQIPRAEKLWEAHLEEINEEKKK